MGPEDGQNHAKTAREEFLSCLRDDLGHLYDSEHLRRSHLASLIGVANRFDTASELRRILTDTIESLKPPDSMPPHSPVWLIYDSLICCYVQQLGQRATADQLGISVRQLRREQRTALEALADRLWGQIRPDGSPHGDVEPALARSSTMASADEELAWLKDHPSEEPTDLNQAVLVVLKLARPLALQHGVRVQYAADDTLPNLAVHPVALNQMLLSLLSVAIPLAPVDTAVRLAAEPSRWGIVIRVECAESPARRGVRSQDERDNLSIVAQLAGMWGGRLDIGDESAEFCVSVTLPALVRVPVLVVDDNADTLQLLQRYTAGTRYRLLCVRDPDQAMDLVDKEVPRVIVLDVMMPQIDGWQVLSRLRQHPVASDIPVIVCTILAQEALALSLGASGFLRKPVTRQAFLSALDQQIAATEQASR